MCGIAAKIIDRAEVAAKEWEHTERIKESLEQARTGCYIPLGLQSDVAWALTETAEEMSERSLDVLLRSIEVL